MEDRKEKNAAPPQGKGRKEKGKTKTSAQPIPKPRHARPKW